jgi:Tfp pilus assembly protein PilF
MAKMTLSRRAALLGTLILLGAVAGGGCRSAQDAEVQKLRARASYERGLKDIYEQRVSIGLLGLREAIELDPSNQIFHNSLGVVLLNIGQPQEAQAEFQKAVELDPQYAEAHHNLGLALAQQGKAEEAIAAYRKALSLPIYPSPELAYYNMGNAYLHLGKRREAEEAYRAAVQLGPKLGVAYFRLGQVLNMEGRKDEAKAAFRKAKDLDPASPAGQAATEALKLMGEGG